MTESRFWPAGGWTLLDGGTATELQRAGVRLEPPWGTSAALRSAAGRAALARVHRTYLTAGADVVTAGTFRTGLRAVTRAGGDPGQAAALVRVAVRLARQAVAEAGNHAQVAGSLAPAENCYRPDLVPDQADLRREHGWLAGQLVAAGVDLVLVETMNRTREAAAATEVARAAGARVWVSFAVGPGGRLLSGEPLAVAAATVTELGAEVVLVNCARPNQVEAALPALAERTAGAYPNVEDRAAVARAGYRPPAVTTAGFAQRAARWVAQYGLAVVGGCCGTTPAHIAALHALRPVPEEAPWRPVTSSRN